MIQGNIQGIRDTVLEELERLYDIDFGREDFLPDRLLAVLVAKTTQLNREIMVYLTREGGVLDIAIGSIGSVGLPERHLRRNWERLSGIRCIHTHPGGWARLSDVDEQALRLLRFDAMCVIGVENGRATGISAAFLGEAEYGSLSIHHFGPVKPGRIPQHLWMREIELADERVMRAARQLDLVEQAEKALLISIDSEESLNELAALTRTAGAVVLGRELQKRNKPEGATYIGSGKAEELALTVQAQEIDLVIVDDELSGAQQRNLEKVLGARVIDRTALILDIFAGRAKSREGKLQVELAQMKYRLPRLTGLGTVLSRLGGGIGTRGPGETRLEVDRRRIRKRIGDLEGELKELSAQRSMRRQRRKKDRQTTVALVGYTNTGKSTLLNALSGSNVLVEDKLFATLDPVVRRIELPENRDCLLVDTVGFIRKLPHQLVEAFRSTLEEALDADLLLIVSDISSPRYAQEREVVYQVLDQLGAAGKPVIEVLNKADCLNEEDDFEPRNALRVSARTGMGLDRLRDMIAEKISALRKAVEVFIPYDKGNLLNLLYERGQVLEEEYLGEGIRVSCEMDGVLYRQICSALGMDGEEYRREGL
ncbi:MAG: GTPase HflX [Bacillota bacterium]|nr:GTPase HflX [Bacillota bacterium]